VRRGFSKFSRRRFSFVNLRVLGGSSFFSTTKATKAHEEKPTNYPVIRLLASDLGKGNN